MGFKPRPKKYQLVILNFGYVESGSLAKAFFYCKGGYLNSKEEAVSHLAVSLLTMFLGVQAEYRSSRRQCCEEAIATKSGAQYCPKCGLPVKTDYNMDSFEEWIEGFPKETCDSFPNTDDWIHWWPWATWDEILEMSDRAVEIEDSAGPVLTSMIQVDDLDEYAKQDGSAWSSLDVPAIKREWEAWAKNRNMDYLKRKIRG